MRRGLATLLSTVGLLGLSVFGVAPALGAHGPEQTPFQAQLQLLPQDLRGVLRDGVALLLSSNRPADGFVTVSLQSSAAGRAGFAGGHSTSVVVGRGTIDGVHTGTAKLHLRLSRSVTARLRRLDTVALLVQIELVSARDGRVSVQAVGWY